MRRILIMLVATVMLSFSMIASAVTAWPGLHTMEQPDGTVLSYYMVGDERGHAFITTDGYMIAANDNGAMCYVNVSPDGSRIMTSVVAHNEDVRQHSEKSFVETLEKADLSSIYNQAVRRASQKRILGGEFPTTGNLKGIIILVDFADNQMIEGHDSTLFHSIMNEQGYSIDGATGSARDYFIDQSHSLFTPDFDIYGPVKVSRNMMYYGENDNQGADRRPGQMIKEACELVHDSLGVDFSKYDFNDDGVVDFVYVIYAGYAESYGASSNTIWPHASNLISLGIDCTLDGKQVQRYACSSELKYTSGSQVEGIGTFCHEFSHVLGLPDMYNTYYSSDVQLGSWDIMDQGSYNNESHTPPSFSAFERYSLGWMELTEINTPADSITLDELTLNNVAYRISTANDNEFFTLENRQQQGWDAYQPGRGLMIIHVAYDESAWNGNYVNVSTQRYDLEEADGGQGKNAQSNLYPTATNNMFTDYSSPSSLSLDGTPTEKGVTNIRDNEGIISFRFMKDRLARPVVNEATDITSESFVANWQSVDDAYYYRLNLQEILPDSINPVITDEDFSLMTEGDYPKSGVDNIASNLEEYMNQQGWTGANIYDAGGYVRIGGYGVSGSLVSPILNLSDADGIFTVAFHAVSYPGKSVNYTVSMTDIYDSSISETFKLKADKNEKEEILYFHKGTATSSISIQTSNERLFLNDLRILKDSVAEENIWTEGPQSWSVDSIFQTSYKVTGLAAERTYIYNVEAIASEELRSSLPSQDMEVTTTSTTSINNVYNSSQQSCLIKNFYDLSGRRVSDKNMPNGIYIMRQGDKVKKFLKK